MFLEFLPVGLEFFKDHYLKTKKKNVTGPVTVMAEAVSVLAQLKQRKPSPQIVATPKTAFEQEVDEDLLLEGTLHWS
jgi:hypothetical protein